MIALHDRLVVQVQAVRSLEVLAQSAEAGRTVWHAEVLERLRVLTAGPLQHHCIGSGSQHAALARKRSFQFQALLPRRVVDMLPCVLPDVQAAREAVAYRLRWCKAASCTARAGSKCAFLVLTRILVVQRQP